MPIRIEVTTTVPDARAAIFKKKFSALGFSKQIEGVEIVDVYTIDKVFTPIHIKKITNALINPITQDAVVRSRKKGHTGKKKWAIEIGFLPGVTDNIASSAKEIIEDLLGISFKNGENVYSSRIIVLTSKLQKKDVIKISETLINPLIQRAYIAEDKDLLPISVPKVRLTSHPKVSLVSLHVSDEELAEIGRNGIKNSDGTRRGPLALNLSYMKEIQAYFKKKKRKPTDIEIESIAQTWSEHCKHTIFADPLDEIKDGLFKTYIKGATDRIRRKKGKEDFCISVFTDNSGGIVFDKDYVLTHKVETHNSPSALDPFGGAVTGIVGVNRDTIGFGLGAKPVINMYGFCFAQPQDTAPLFKDKNLAHRMLSPKRIMQGVVDGVNNGGNCSGIPTPQGFVYFHDRYKGKPLVFVGTVGLMPQKSGRKALYKKMAMPGDYIVMVGGRVGKDGVHGATFSSVALDSSSPAAAVQIGDPITQKKLSDALIKEARGLGLYTSITDDGAGGLSCSVSEMAKETGGCTVDLSAVPLKYSGLEPWEIWISESQERMTLSVPKKKWRTFSSLMKKRGVEATIIGTFSASGTCRVTYKGKTIMNIDLEFLHNGLPKNILKSEYTKDNKKPTPLPRLNFQEVLLDMMGRLNLSSTEFISSQYDHEVQAGSVLKPIQGKGRVIAEVSVTRPLLSSSTGVVLSQALYPTYTELDPYKMAACCVDTAIRNAVSVGGNIDRMALLDNFCWCSSRDPKRLYQLKEAVRACYESAVSYETPFISGKDSMFNDFNGYTEDGKPISISIPPTLLVSTIGTIPKTTHVVSLDFKFPGDMIYVLGETYDEMGGSEFLEFLSEKTKKEFTGTVPGVDFVKNKKLYKRFYKAVQKDCIASSLSVGRGGLFAALAKSAVGGRLGVEISLGNLPGGIQNDLSALFSESQGRILVSVSERKSKVFEACMEGIPMGKIGRVTLDGNVVITGIKKKKIARLVVSDLEKAYKRRFKGY